MGKTSFKDPTKTLYGHMCSECEISFYVGWVGKSTGSDPICVECGSNNDVTHTIGDVHVVYNK